MRKRRNLIVAAIIIFVLLVLGLIWAYSGGNNDSATIKINNAVIKVDVADEPAEITLGLGNRQSLASNEGLLFILPQSIVPSFWMKDMKFPIDVVWLDENKTIVAITPSIAVETFPTTFSPPKAVKYVLEVNAGISAQSGWLAGDLAEISL